MRILWFSNILLPSASRALGCPVNVAGGWLQSMLDGLRTLSPDVKFCVLCLYPQPCDVVVEGVRYVSFGEDYRSYYADVPRRIQNQVKDVIREFNPDVIHIQGTEFYSGAMGKDVYCGKPIVISMQGIITACANHYTGGLTPAELRWAHFNLRTLRHCRTLFGEQAFWGKERAEQEQRIIKQARYFIGRTAWDESWIRYCRSDAFYFKVNETLRPEFYSANRKQTNIRRHSIYCGAAAGYPLKGVHWLMRAIAALKREYPDVTLRIAAAKERLSMRVSLFSHLRDDAYSIYLRNLIRNLHLEDNVVLLPYLSASEVVGELEKAELFVLPSLCENSPNSLCEAMLVGTPVIATYVGGIPSIVENNKDGILVQPGDPSVLSSAIHQLFARPEVANEYASRARDMALKRHDARQNAKATLCTYQSILKMELQGRG